MREHRPELIAVNHTYHYQEFSITNPLDFGKVKFKEDIFMQEKGKSPENRKEVEQKYAEMQSRDALASEVIAWGHKVSKAKDFAIGCLVLGIIIVGIGMAIINYCNDRDWRELFSSYDYVSQDGEGYNYYNSGIGGNVENGSEDKETEE